MGESGHGAAPAWSLFTSSQENPARGWAGWSCGWLWPSCSLLLQSFSLLTRLSWKSKSRDLEEDMDEEEMGEARDMDDENEDESNLVDDEADTEEGVEVVSSKDPQEIARFNN